MFIIVLELIGTVAFAASGAAVAIGRKMDILGVAILGAVTAIGGGVCRDIILGITPPYMFKDPTYAVLAFIASIIIFLPVVRRVLAAQSKTYEITLLIMDSLGLGSFTVVGIKTAVDIGHRNFLLLLFVGVITGVGGGVLRDVLAGNTPYIFVKHFYACASIIGAAICILLWQFIGETASMVIGSSTVVLLRILAAYFRWSLPKAES